jgi:hypothetical protein
MKNAAATQASPKGSATAMDGPLAVADQFKSKSFNKPSLRS